MFCKHCGKEIHNNAVICVLCGCAVSTSQPPVIQDANRGLIVFLLCFFLGGFGIHRFYVGKIGTGVLMLLTLGCCGVLTLIDLIRIVMGDFSDAEGNKIRL